MPPVEDQRGYPWRDVAVDRTVEVRCNGRRVRVVPGTRIEQSLRSLVVVGVADRIVGNAADRDRLRVTRNRLTHPVAGAAAAGMGQRVVCRDSLVERDGRVRHDTAGAQSYV